MSLSRKIKGIGIPIRVGTIKMTRYYILSLAMSKSMLNE